MATIRRTITLSENQDLWIKAQVDAGHYANDSECIRDLIQREQERNAEVGHVRAALIEGESSGDPMPFDPRAFKQRMRAGKG
ncbi:MAG: type II toxin-antitoxin system ParD family antitoxin [Pseudomonadota bacterium]